MTDAERTEAEALVASVARGELGPAARDALREVALAARDRFLMEAMSAITLATDDKCFPEAEPIAPPKGKAEVFRPPSDDIEQDDSKLMEAARSGLYGPRLARAIEVGGLSVAQVRFTVEQLLRPGRSQAAAPTEDP